MLQLFVSSYWPTLSGCLLFMGKCTDTPIPVKPIEKSQMQIK